MWHRTCRWLGLDRGREQRQDTTVEDQQVGPEMLSKQQQDTQQSPVAFSPDCWVHQQDWLCDALRSMDQDQVRDSVQGGASPQAPDSGVSVSFGNDAEVECGSRRSKSLHANGRQFLRQAWLL